MKFKLFLKNCFVDKYGKILESDSEFVNSFDSQEEVDNFFDSLYRIFTLSGQHKIIKFDVDNQNLFVFNNDGSYSSYSIEDLPF